MAVTGIDNWEYSKWISTMGRSLRMNPAAGAELAAVESFFAFEKTKRPWLRPDFFNNSSSETGTGLDNPQVLGRQIEVIGRDIMRIPVIDAAELSELDTVIAATINRRFGAKSGTIAADVDQTP